ncbi:Putative glutathione S-transferase [Methyloversatilis universalis FAM5]|uniref:Glutathione S-transferase n=1 Tax=Methyloversatilis universalis (strain ATCC BAA-1314 / DSM 25237 / JCM 13912 / CCUG 52030 / FAM5) TaxID=1000565 RepID=F5R7F3_METUF|nr:glutathione S-transferase [Methyloversatilis universalis]EGK73539.1 Putative glutathione S-transferase [Methyloversatilis universalis FAM5]
MKLVGSYTSPYVRKTRVVLAEKKIDCELVIDSPWTDSSGVPDLNPLGKIPVLVLDDDTRLFDSRVIVEYLDGVAPNNKLLPAPARERALVKRWEALADGLIDAAVAILLEGRRADGERSEGWIARQQLKIERALAALAADLGDDAWCHGTAISLADIAVGCALGYLDFRQPALDWRGAHPNLARLQDKLLQRASFSDTVPHD